MKNLILALALIAMTGCATQSFTLHNSGSGTLSKEDSQSFFISGLGQEKQFNAATICGGADKVAKVEVELTFLDGFLGGLTLGIYTPRTARVYCIQ
ncbi:MAG: Bor family protein [Mariprofundaceae bacterium]|nr:Bor family protein [Mariprofundaceae bacterium]